MELRVRDCAVQLTRREAHDVGVALVLESGARQFIIAQLHSVNNTLEDLTKLAEQEDLTVQGQIMMALAGVERHRLELMLEDAGEDPPAD